MNSQTKRASAWLGAALVLLSAAAGVRVALLGVDVRLHPDEALFATQARTIALGGDLFLRGADVDKPPLTLYTMALSFRALGAHEWSARLPNVFFSLLSVATLYALARDLYRDRAVGWGAAALWAFSPYALGFAATAFTDVQAVFWGLLGMWSAVRGRWGWAGVALGLGTACKTSTWQTVPLALVLGGLMQAKSAPTEPLPPASTDRAAHARQRGQRPLRKAGVWKLGLRDHVRSLAHMVAPLALSVGALMLWDATRAPRSFWALARAHNLPDRWARSDEVGARLSAWLGWARWAVGAEWLGVALALGVGMLLVSGWRRRGCAAALDWTLAGYGLAWLGAYWLIAFNTYDRYLYPLVPFLLILGARAWVSVWRALGARQSVALVLIAALSAGSVLSARAALRGELPLGGDRGRHNGIDGLAATLNAKLAGVVVYDHWLGWELGYYLGTSPRVQLRYMPQPEALADDLRAAGEVRYLVAPEQEVTFWLYVLREAGCPAQRIEAVGRFAVYRLGLCAETSFDASQPIFEVLPQRRMIPKP